MQEIGSSAGIVHAGAMAARHKIAGMTVLRGEWCGIHRPLGNGWSEILDIRREVLLVLDEVLSLGGRAESWNLDRPLLGVVPELDSMAVIGVLNLLEERFGFNVEDDDVDGRTFETVGTLVAFVAEKLA